MTSTPNRAKLIVKLHAALKKHYETPPANPSRPLLEHAMYACLLEDAPLDLADEALAKLEQDYFDWNEVRVTTVSELKTVLGRLPDPQKTAQRLKTVLQAIFEEFYSFDLDHLKKENLGKAVAKFEALAGMTPFVLSYIVQHGLGGHAIPIDYSAMVVMLVTGIASQNEAAAGRVPGLERAIPKNKGVEFSYLLHQPAVALTVDPDDKKARQMLEAVAKGSAASLDEYRSSKAAAKERVLARRAEEREVAKQEAVDAAAEAEAKAAEVVEKPSAVKKVKAKAMTAAEQAAETAEKTARAKKTATRKTTQKKPKASESGQEGEEMVAEETVHSEPKVKASEVEAVPSKPVKSATKPVAAKTKTSTAPTPKPIETVPPVTPKTEATKTKSAKKSAPEAPPAKPISKKKSSSSTAAVPVNKPVKPVKPAEKSSKPVEKSAKVEKPTDKKAANRKLTKSKPR